MKAFRFKGLLQKDGWLMPAYVRLDEQGNITDIRTEKQQEITYTEVNGFALPGMQNAHSHAFQYAMVGLAEQHGKQSQDDFWAWRKAMYQLALAVRPAQMEAIATMLYAEMLRHGYTSVAEFHYVHHDQLGKPYANLAELGERLLSAAERVGIKITLIPICYQKGGFGMPANPEQRRFLSPTLADYHRLLEATEKAVLKYPKARIGVGVHSMRAVEPMVIRELVNQIQATYPFHIHVSEQLKEVEASLTYLGKRPVEWLLDNLPVTENFHLVHATHLTKTETKALAKSRARVVLCPSTEGNLGDGLFNLKTFQQHGGNWSIGTDSHVGLNPFEELRILDYGQRLISHERNTFTDETYGNSGLYALNQLIFAGNKAMGFDRNNFFQKNQSFDALIIDGTIPIFDICSVENLTSSIVYASDISMYLGTMINGEWVIKNGKHPLENPTRRDFSKALRELNNR